MTEAADHFGRMPDEVSREDVRQFHEAMERDYRASRSVDEYRAERGWQGGSP